MKKLLLVLIFGFSLTSFSLDYSRKVNELTFNKVYSGHIVGPFVFRFYCRIKKNNHGDYYLYYSNVWRPSSPDSAACGNIPFRDLDFNDDGKVVEQEYEDYQPPPDFGVDKDGDGWSDRLEKQLGMDDSVWEKEPPSDKLMSIDTKNVTPENIQIGSEVADRYTGRVLGRLAYGTGKDGTQEYGIVDDQGNFYAFKDYNLGRLLVSSDGSGKHVILDHPNGQSYPSDGSNSAPSGGGSGGSGGGDGFKPPSQSEITNPDIDDSETPVNTDNSEVVGAVNEMIRANAEHARKEAERDKVISQQIYNQSNIMLDGNDLLGDIKGGLGDVKNSVDNVANAINDLSDKLDGNGQGQGDGELDKGFWGNFIESTLSKSSKFSEFKGKLSLPDLNSQVDNILFEIPAYQIGDYEFKAMSFRTSTFSSALSVIRVILIAIIHFFSFMKIFDCIGSIFNMRSL